MAHPIENLNQFNAEEAGNMEEIEMQFAVKTVEHLEAYEKLITGIPPSKIKLTSMDDDIVADLYTRFPEYNFGTLVRKDSDRCYSEENSMLVTRAQFVAVEIVRNRNGLNNKVYEDAQAAKAKK
jgi:hypothetical protein